MLQLMLTLGLAKIMYKNKKKIFMAGDSWGVGEWSGKPPPYLPILHRGIEKYFCEDGYDVLNMSSGGASLNQIKNQFTYGNNYDIAKKCDLILVFVTSTDRDFFEFCNKTMKFKEINDNFWCYEHYNEYVNHHNSVLKNFLIDLNKLNLNIKLLGGHTKVEENDIKDLKNLEIAISSIPEFLIPEFKHCINYTSACDPNTICNAFFKEKKKRNITVPNLECLEKMIENEEQFDLRKYDIMKPDGYHPNRHGHRIMYEFLKQKYFC